VRLAVTALALALATPAAAEVIAVPELDFVDSSGEVRDQAADHAARLARFAETLRAELAASGAVEVALPACAGPCSPARTPFAAMAEATRAAGAERLLVGNVHKISTLIGSVKLTLIDLPGDRVLCTRVLSYRGDDDQAWDRAARFAAEDVLRHCLP
jgi:Protein of unknown function (DUF2380)